MEKTDKSVDLLKLMRGPGNQTGLKIIKVETTDPDPITFTFEGTAQAIDLVIFEIPVSCYPLRKGDRLLAYPLLDKEASQRWGVLQKINGGITLATMAGATSLNVAGIDKTYGADDLLIPSYFAVGNSSSIYSDSYTGKQSDDYLLSGDIQPLKAGDTVSIAPYWDDAASKVKYAILALYS